MSKIDDFKRDTKDMRGYVAAALTDEFIVDTWPMTNSTLEGKEQKILEVRVFNDTRDVKLFRTDIGKDFKPIRVADDDDDEYKDVYSFTEEQILDIDTKKSEEGPGYVKTIGGGRYYLPVRGGKVPKVVIKYYVSDDHETGMAKITDWRVAGFREG